VHQCQQVEIKIVVENWIDMLLSEGTERLDFAPASLLRYGLIEHFDPRRTPPQAENGISLLVTARSGRHRQRTLFDAGLTGTVLAHNLAVLDEDPATIDHAVISHGHPDHFGGIFRLLELVQGGLPVASHPDSFLPRYAVMADGQVAPFYNLDFRPSELERSGARLVLSREPLDLGCGVYTTGEIPRRVTFEGPPKAQSFGDAGLYQVSGAGSFRLDEVLDEQGLVIDVDGSGLVVLTGCAHAGVINTILRAREVCGEKPIAAVMGGFHLGFPTTPSENVLETLNAMRDLDVRLVVPMHCSGLRAHTAFSEKLPGRYLQPAVGTTVTIGS
jgi:7,8-dihydropterin-6-yl-methyl-4-(beta-D-ribofuranosyl)aminobenzene 5'-phosphate synthase